MPTTGTSSVNGATVRSASDTINSTAVEDDAIFSDPKRQGGLAPELGEGEWLGPLERRCQLAADIKEEFKG